MYHDNLSLDVGESKDKPHHLGSRLKYLSPTVENSHQSVKRGRQKAKTLNIQQEKTSGR